MNELLLLTPLSFSFYVHEGEVADDNDNVEEAAALIKSTWLWPQRMWKGSAKVVSTPNGSLDSVAPQVMEAHIVKGPDDWFFCILIINKSTGHSALMHTLQTLISCQNNKSRVYTHTHTQDSTFSFFLPLCSHLNPSFFFSKL